MKEPEADQALAVLAQRLLLAVLGQDPAILQAIATDIADVQTMARLSSCFMGWTLDVLLHMAGGDMDEVRRFIERGLLEDLDRRNQCPE